MSHPVSPLKPTTMPKLPVVPGVLIAMSNTGMRYKGRDDLLYMEFIPGTQSAGVFTLSHTASACVLWGREILPEKEVRAHVVVAGISNVFNGEAGMRSVHAITHKVAADLECSQRHVQFSATGIIGVPLPDDKILKTLSSIRLHLKEDAWEQATYAINTTDTFAKWSTRSAVIDGKKVVINGIIKGSGMVEPNMATMLGYIATDAAIPAHILQELLNEYVDVSFNAITVDSDTSTSDTIMLFATGSAGNKQPSSTQDVLLNDFKVALREVCIELAQLVVKDGEGATKFITIEVTGAENHREAKIIGKSVANSPLVKTAIAGEDANWGRIAAAVGKASAHIDQRSLSIGVGGIWMARNGQLNPDYREADVVPLMKRNDITIQIDLGLGNGNATVWTCDLTECYIRINADYRS
ncbi:MAG: bifunctional glutamate N-acetyltransferase/amino-acid acetyltransferase ArgJ [Alphaproteobacteria bacterium]|nr:bifunctional glutamate N-acetyltransferase/amino-acid acetyltransferase ArgJ [Alphaproteobacteria bacterium]